ncbi:PREDICTED: transcription repressor MYB6-like [Nelumbo nucifera]|uniref:Transcription repressor MYB6-like n=2 Tax=Nelumbo nucifera TaxID=4432 RepID=A0A1U8AIF6_NELNU|nr:PREDICTED: transcription repressor MYB6-like [Nelumbo nucifera]DAD44298.1 TPA_asm: hypothetical protein HUJ06_002528 [Nelumbo nucifera]
MGRSPCCVKEGLNRGAWTVYEDQILIDYITTHGDGKWKELPKKAGLNRCGKSCRLRWLNYLRPGIKRGNISAEEEELIMRLHRLLGNRWSLIAGRLPGRTDNEIKNYWNTSLSKKLRAGDQTPEKQVVINKSKGKKMVEAAGNSALSTLSSKVSQEPPRVIRTKAVRCTRVFFPPQQGSECHHVDETMINKREEPALASSSSGFNCTPSTLSSIIQADGDYSNFLTDLDIGELLSMPDFLQFCSEGIDHQENDNVIMDGEDLPWFSDYPFSAPYEIMLPESTDDRCNT